MKNLILTVALFVSASFAQASNTNSSKLIEPIRGYVTNVVQNFDSIPEHRRAMLKETADYLADDLKARKPANLVFICTHNSRRSHMSQVWLSAAAVYYGLTNVHAYSGGVEVTACNARTVAAMRRAGLSVVTTTEGKNPVYLAQYAEDLPPLELYSKNYKAKGNPKSGYVAVMCCADADRRCPVVSGSDLRIPLHYADPKDFDGTSEEPAAYDTRCKQIATEMFYMISLVAKNSTVAKN